LRGAWANGGDRDTGLRQHRHNALATPCLTRGAGNSQGLQLAPAGVWLLAGERCPIGSLLTVSPWLIQRHRRHWPDPDRFRPERFLRTASAAEQQLARDAFLPYGLGPRKCPGAAFAQQEAVLVLAELLERFVIAPVVEHRPELVGRLTLRSRNGIQVRLLRRAG
jgi:cytochrome P450